MKMINWVQYPRSHKPSDISIAVVKAFETVAEQIDSSLSLGLDSNSVLAAVGPYLESVGFVVEGGKKSHQKISVPVLFGLNGKIQKSFDADAYHAAAAFVLEVEAGRGVINNQFLKDLFQACMMDGVKLLGIAVCNTYRKGKNFDYVVRFFDTMYASNRLKLPLDGILVIGY